MSNDDIQPLTVTVEQAAKLLGIGRSTAYELVHAGDIPSLRLGRRIVVPICQIANKLGAPADAVATAAAEPETSLVAPWSPTPGAGGRSPAQPAPTLF
jgi:excisionase family DNA binding protein